MKYKDKTKEQLINELAELHQRIEDLAARETGRRQAGEVLRKAYDEMDLRQLARLGIGRDVTEWYLGLKR